MASKAKRKPLRFHNAEAVMKHYGADKTWAELEREMRERRKLPRKRAKGKPDA